MTSRKKQHSPVYQSLLILVLVLLAVGWLVEYLDLGDIMWPAYLSMVAFYALIFFAALWAGQRSPGDHILANKSLPLGLAVFTMSATWVGGGFINGTAEYTYSSGLIWVQAPWGYAMSLILGGLFFAGPMRSRGYTTMLDPLEARFGRRLNVLFYLPALMGDLFWTSAILVALGSTFGTILGLSPQLSIVLSALIVIIYTSSGGLWSVAVTDVIQLLVLIVGLMIVVWVVFSGEQSLGSAWSIYRNEMGSSASFLPNREALGAYWAYWWDSALMLMLGGIPWQVYFQRVLAASSATVARRLSVISGVVCLVAAIPAVMIGIAAVSTDWEVLQLSGPPDPAYTLPYVIQNLTNPWVATLGLGAIAAAVMSSADSSILSAASLTTWNILPRNNQAKDPSQKVMRRIIWIVGITTMLIALKVTSIYVLWVLCSDLVYCLLLAPLITALFDRKSNAYGAVAGFVVAFILRAGGGEPAFGIDPWLPYPVTDDIITFPFRTLAMLSNLVTIMVVSRLWPIRWRS